MQDQKVIAMSELIFKGKEFVYNHHLAVPHRPLVPHPEKSIGDGRTDGNLIIHGDNLLALKSLLPMYAGKVDCVFIDPPYNTGNEGWCYNDNVNSPMMQEWLKSNPVGIEDGLRHDKWCAMMWPRLRLLHDLLSDTGSFWMTLDDNEMHNARGMLDAIFGQENFLGVVIWEKADSPKMDADYFSTSHDYLIAYAKSKAGVIFQRVGKEDEAPDHYSMEDEDGRKYYLKPLRAMGGQGETRESRPNLFFGLDAPDGTKVFPKLQDGRDGAWRWSLSKIAKESNRIEWRNGRNGWSPYFRIYADVAMGRPPETIFYNADVGSSRSAKAQIKALFGGSTSFETPKPLGLLERVMEIATGPDALVLDSFSGSGTTAHAVLVANNKDGGNRKFILVESEDYADELTAERVRRVINGYAFTGTQREELLRKSLTFTDLKNADKLLDQITSIENLDGHRFDSIEKKVKDGELLVEGVKAIAERTEGLGGSFTFCTLGPAIEMDKMLTGETLPTFEQLGALLYHMATNESFDATKSWEKDGHGYLGESTAFHVWLIYKPNLDFLKSRDAALTLSKAKALVETKPGKRHLVFAPAKFVSQKLLNEENLPVEFAPLPFALYRIERS
jgi:adenine-specific DNA-methyltransferase